MYAHIQSVFFLRPLSHEPYSRLRCLSELFLIIYIYIFVVCATRYSSEMEHRRMGKNLDSVSVPINTQHRVLREL